MSLDFDVLVIADRNSAFRQNLGSARRERKARLSEGRTHVTDCRKRPSPSYAIAAFARHNDTPISPAPSPAP
jgi:hypothetical protein